MPRLVVLITAVIFVSPASAGDWPMWRYDSNRSAASPEKLSANLKLVWSREFSPRKQTWDDALNNDLMTYDRVFEPIVADGRMFVGFNDKDKVVALDVATGRELWTFYCDGPVRFPPVAHEGTVLFTSDDGYLYCVDATDGTLKWRKRGGPSNRKALGNQRIISAWPARGGPVVRDGHVYFAASIWPFMGTFIYSLDAKSGEVIWVNDRTGSQYIKQPHSAPSFAGVAPQGAMVATEKYLIVPGGRSVPAVFDRQTGEQKYFHINAGGKGNGGSSVFANEKRFFLHTRLKGMRAFDLESGKKTAFQPNEPVLSGDIGYAALTVEDKHLLQALRVNLKHKKPKKDAKKNSPPPPDPHLIWEVEADATGDLILAGNELVAGGENGVTIIRLPDSDSPPQITRQLETGFKPERLLAANGMLFAVGIDGTISAFGTHGAKQTLAYPSRSAQRDLFEPVHAVIADMLAAAGHAEGYAIWFDPDDDDAKVIEKLGERFKQLTVVDADADFIGRLRTQLDARGTYGPVTAHVAEPASFHAPPYVANMVIVGKETTKAAARSPALAAALYESVRPYGGVMQLRASGGTRQFVMSAFRAMDLPQAEISESDIGVVVRKVGPLPGSASWTHQYGNIANTVKSNDKRVRLPLGVLWFGGPSNVDVLPRHGHGPPEQVIGGRLFIEGMNSLSARDVYTGRLLWKREFGDLGTYDVYYNETYVEDALDPQYGQRHIPGANARGTNFVAADDRVYVVEGSTCHVLSPVTGKSLLRISLPQDDTKAPKEWGFIGVYEDVLVGGIGFANYRTQHDLPFLSDKLLKGNAKGFGSKSFDRAASRALVGFDRRTGKQLWRVDAKHSFWHNGIVAGGGKVFCLDKNPFAIEKALQRRGKAAPTTYRMLAIDHKTGEVAWERSDDVFGTWLAYDQKTDCLLQAGARASDRVLSEVGSGMAIHRASDGSIVWHKPKLKYNGPCILHGDYILTNANSYKESAGAFRILDGEQKMVPHPITGEEQPWKITRAYGCNNVIACENFLTFRSGAAGFYDLQTNSGTGNLGGFKTGCTSNLVVADGVLNAPDYTRTCSCAYQNQTSLGLVHMRELDIWTVNHDASAITKADRIEHIGINFAAPGDRKDDDGTLWLEYPNVAGDSAPLQIDFDGKPRFTERHPATVESQDLPWVFASGVTGIRNVRINMRLGQPIELNKSGIAIDSITDDAEENTQGKMNLTSSDLEFVRDKNDQLVGLRFNRVPIARGSAVKSAYIQFTSDNATSDQTELLIRAEDVGNATTFGKAKHNISSRVLTAQTVVWEPPPWKKSGESTADQRTADIGPLVQAIVNRDDWEPGNSIAFVVSGSGRRVADATGGRDAPGARLVVDAKTVKLRPLPLPQKKYRVRLFFNNSAEPPTDNEFGVVAQGKPVGRSVRIGARSRRTAVRTFEIEIGETLEVGLNVRKGTPTLCGIEMRSVTGP